MLAIECGHIKIAQRMLEVGGDTNIPNMKGESTLHNLINLTPRMDVVNDALNKHAELSSSPTGSDTKSFIPVLC